jgi:hypothetical protein
MAKVWFMREGSDPTTGAPAYDELPLERCIEQLGLAKSGWLHGLDQTPHFQAPLAKSGWLHGLDQTPHFQAPRPVAVPEYRHAVCQVDEPEASEYGWRAGYYLLEISPKEVANRLGPPA